MELKTYISESLIQICEGIKLAKEQVKSTNNENREIIAPHASWSKESTVHFDIALTIIKSNKASANTGIESGNILEVIGLKGGVDGNISNQSINSNIQKISFDISFLPYLLTDKNIKQ